MAASTSTATEKSTKKLAVISLFGGVNLGLAKLIPPVVEAGKILGQRKGKVIYGGGCFGLIGCAIHAAQTHGSSVVGVTVPNLRKAYGKTIGIEVKAESLFERSKLMIMHSDAFIALPGGFESLEQIFCVISWASLNLHSKPIGFLNVENHFNGLLNFIEVLVNQQLVSPTAKNMICVASTMEELLGKLEAYVPIINLELPVIDWPEDKRKRENDPNELDLDLKL